MFVGRADDQVKVGGRRIELGEVDSALLGAARASPEPRRRCGGPRPGTSVLVGYLVPEPGVELDLADARAPPAPARCRPRWSRCSPRSTPIPTRGSGKVDRDALPWPLARPDEESAPAVGLTADRRSGWRERWTAALGVAVAGPRDDFFASGGGSLVAAQLVSALRERFPTVTVADVYEYPRIGDLARTARRVRADRRGRGAGRRARRRCGRSSSRPCWPSRSPPLVGLRWLTWLLAADAVLVATTGAPWVPVVPGVWWWVALGWLVLISPLGRMGTTVLVARTLLRGLRARPVPARRVRAPAALVHRVVGRRGRVPRTCPARPGPPQYARALGATIGRDVDLHALPPVTGLLTLGNGCAVEPEVDLRGHWLDGDVLRVGRVRIDKRATVGTRSTLAPGTRVGARARGRARVRGARLRAARRAVGGVARGVRRTGAGGTGRATRRPAAPLGGRLRGDGRGARGAAGGRRRVRAARRRARASGTRRRGPRRRSTRCGPSRSARVTMVVVLAVVTLVSVRLLGLGLPRGVPRGAQPGGLAGVGDAAAHGRRAHHAVPALLEHGDAGVAAGARRGHRQGRRGVDRAHAARR